MRLSDKQKEFWNLSSKRWNIKQGATRSGKTYLDYFMIPRRIRECKNSKGLIMLIGNTQGTLKRNIWEPMRDMYGSRLVGNISSDNSLMLFYQKAYLLGADKVNQVAKLQGSSIKYAYGDEITTWSEEVFQMLKSRLSEPESVFDGTCNPDSPSHWFKSFLDSDADIFQQHYNIDDNPFLSQSFVENLKKEYAGTVYYNRFILGQWMRAEGLVYPMFTKDKYVRDTRTDEPQKYRYYISIDYGTANPTVFLLWRLNGNNTTSLVKEYYWDSRKENKQKTDEQYYQDLCQFAQIDGKEIYIESVIPDPSAASFIEVIRQRGRFNIRKADNTVLDGIRTTATYLNANKIFIDESCKNTINEFGAYSWDDKSNQDAVIKESDHCLTGETLVNTVNGAIPIQDLVGKTGYVHCYHQENKKETISKFYNVRETNASADVFEIELEDGRLFRATGNHPVLTQNGWKKIIDLDLFDKILQIGIKNRI